MYVHGGCLVGLLIFHLQLPSMPFSFLTSIPFCASQLSLITKKSDKTEIERGFLNTPIFLSFPTSISSIPYGGAARQECSAALRTLLILRASRTGSWCLSLFHYPSIRASSTQHSPIFSSLHHLPFMALLHLSRLKNSQKKGKSGSPGYYLTS